MKKKNLRLWFSRLLITLVFGINIECAIVFIVLPEKYVTGFELHEITGIVMVQGLGILFLMWNVPYLFALLHPLRFRISLIEACIMQFIGFVSESALLMHIPNSQVNLRTTLERFILFDGTGLLLLLISLLMMFGNLRKNITGNNTFE